MVLSKAELIDIVKSLFSEDRKVSRVIVELFLAGKSRITFDEILSIARNIEKSGGAENLAVESTLVMEGWRLMLPARTKHEGSIQWDNRLNRPIPGETYEIPTCIGFAFEYLRSQGIWSWRLAVKAYMESIKQPNQQIILDIIGEIVKDSHFRRFVSASAIHEACKRHNYSGDVDALIAELKSGGIISPCVKHSIFSRKFFEKYIENFSKSGPLYELNKALFIFELSEDLKL